jgi:hypothetical protein
MYIKEYIQAELHTSDGSRRGLMAVIVVSWVLHNSVHVESGNDGSRSGTV